MNRPNPSDERLYNAIEKVYGRMHRRESPDAMMQMIRDRFPNPSCFLESNTYILRRIGLRRLDAFYFAMIPAMSRRVKRQSYGKRPRLNTLSKMSEYLKSLFIGVHVECFYVVMLDSRGYMIDTVLVQKGTYDSAPFYLKEMLSIVVQHEAKAIVLCHNHPRGTLQPSKEDINCTLKTMNAMLALGVPMLDHVIIANRHAVSMRDCGAVASKLWMMQAPNSRLMRNWVDVDTLLEIEEKLNKT